MSKLDRDGLLAAIDRHFLAPEALRRVAVFSRAGADLDGWFKGELAFALAELASAGQIAEWGVNVPITEDRRKLCDLRVVLEGGTVWLELKAIQHRVRPGPGADILSQIGDSLGVTDDVVRLLRVPEGSPHIVIFVYPRPEPETWSALMEAYRRRIYPIAVDEMTSPADYPRGCTCASWR